jgi:predicted transcriptional regulator
MATELTPDEQVLFTNFYKLTPKDKESILEMKKKYGMTVDEIARKFRITPPDVNRILHPPKNYGNWTAEEKLRHWVAGKRRAATVKRQRDEKMKKNNFA